MNSNYSRFRINALIQMARTTENQDKREEYIMLAEEELCKLSKHEYHESSIELFFNEKCIPNDSARTDRTKIYKKYVSFCQQQSIPYLTKNCLYKFLRENGISEVKGKGTWYFKADVV